jgi:hypothetical protein
MKKSILPKVPAAFALFALCSFHAPADTIKLKDGKSIDGTIIAEDASSVTIKTIVVGKITDNKVVPRSEIASLVKGFRPSRVRPQNLRAYFPAVRRLLELKGGGATVVNGTIDITDHPRVFG